jgi:hypothetical protein
MRNFELTFARITKKIYRFILIFARLCVTLLRKVFEN